MDHVYLHIMIMWTFNICILNPGSNNSLFYYLNVITCCIYYVILCYTTVVGRFLRLDGGDTFQLLEVNIFVCKFWAFSGTSSRPTNFVKEILNRNYWGLTPSPGPHGMHDELIFSYFPTINVGPLSCRSKWLPCFLTNNPKHDEPFWDGGRFFPSVRLNFL